MVTVSDPDREVSYEVIQPPSLGRLMMESETLGIFKVVSKFTQSDLNESRIYYEHTHPFADLYMNDSFVFNARAHFTEPLLNKVIKLSCNSNVLFLMFCRSWTSLFLCLLVAWMLM